MIRVIHVLESLNRNGTETFIMNLLRNIDRSKLMFDFLIFKESDHGFQDEVLKLGSRIYILPHRKKNLIAYRKALNNFFMKHSSEYSVIHMHGMSLTTIAPLVYAKKFGVEKRIFHIHSTKCSGFHNRILHSINRRRLSRYTTLCLACSKQSVSWINPDNKPRPASEILVNGIDLSRFKFCPNLRRSLRVEYAIGDKTMVIGHVGSFNQVKNQQFLLRLLDACLKKGLDVRLCCVGTGKLFENFKRKVKSKGLQDKVILPGFTEKPEEYLRLFDIFVMPSLHEGFPLALIEAQCAGLPVLVSDKITAETKLTPNFRFLSLKTNILEWVDACIDLSGENRDSGTDNSSLAPYSIKNTVKKLEAIYNV